VIALFTLLSCSLLSEADPLPGEVEPAEDLGTVAEPLEDPEVVERVEAAVEVLEPLPAEEVAELTEAEAVELVEAAEESGEVEVLEAGGVTMAPDNWTEHAAPLALPEGPNPWLRLADEIGAAVSVATMFFLTLIAILRKIGPVVEEVRGYLRDLVATKRTELKSMERSLADALNDRDMWQAEAANLRNEVRALQRQIADLTQPTPQRRAAPVSRTLPGLDQADERRARIEAKGQAVRPRRPE
jgi:hypothetical protein